MMFCFQTCVSMSRNRQPSAIASMPFMSFTFYVVGFKNGKALTDQKFDKRGFETIALVPIVCETKRDLPSHSERQ